MRRLLLVACAVALVFSSVRAFAAGFEIPDLGTEALGRGGAFAAKADSGLALYYDPAGLAGQRGTRILLDANLVIHDTAFTRAGAYAGDPTDPRTPWAGRPFPTVHNEDHVAPQPIVAVSSDFGWFQRWTFALGLFAPPGIGQNQWGTRRTSMVTDRNGVQHETVAYTASAGGITAPAPSRYDLADTNFTILFPTAAAAFRPWWFLDVGVAVHLVYASFDLLNANITNAGPSTCVGSPEYPGCDSYGEVKTSAVTATATISALAHPLRWLDVALAVRPQANLDSSGTIHAYPVPSDGTQLPDFPGTFSIKLPTVVRWGVRAVRRDPTDGRDKYDLELDGTWENWSVEKAARVHGSDFPLGTGSLDIAVPHDYHDTFSFRLGGAYNLRFAHGLRLALRAGGYYESATTDDAHTRLDAMTAMKLAGTLGMGLTWRGVAIDLAYAGIWMPSRTVTDSTVQAASSVNGTNWPRDSMGNCIDPCPVVGDGRYEWTAHIVSVGVTFTIDDFKGTK